MASGPPLIALKSARLSYGGPPLFEALDIGLLKGERACLVGRNGSGKSSLLKALAGRVELDAGERFLQPGCVLGYLPQDPAAEEPDFRPEVGVLDYVASGLGAKQEDLGHRAEALLDAFRLEAHRSLASLSGGEGRRAALARALVAEPDVLLLDEPTNHLDLPTIEALEDRLAAFRGALLLISHDRAFLNRLAGRTYWLDRGRLHLVDKPFRDFPAWLEDRQKSEESARHKVDRQIVREERWHQRGVTARRKRNQGRLERLKALRQHRREWLAAPGEAKLQLAQAGRGSQMLIEATHLTKGFAAGAAASNGDGTRTVVGDFSTRIVRGERIGIIGPNGAGKTTLARLLIGELAADEGALRLAQGLRILYFDQTRQSLDPNATPWQILAPGGGDSLVVQGRQRHVAAYLRDFLFEDSQARQPIRTLSGGEKNRLLLARLFAQPGDLVVLDEPTNDLDIETLDLLEATLADYDGSVLLISHDRDFLDRVVNGVVVLAGDGTAQDYAGGYSDYLRQRPAVAEGPAAAKPKRAKSAAERPARTAARKLSYKDQREFELLPAEIDRLQGTVETLEDRLADPEFYRRDPAAFAAAGRSLEETKAQLAAQEERWLQLAELKEQLERQDSKP